MTIHERVQRDKVTQLALMKALLSSKKYGVEKPYDIALRILVHLNRHGLEITWKKGKAPKISTEQSLSAERLAERDAIEAEIVSIHNEYMGVQG